MSQAGISREGRRLDLETITVRQAMRYLRTSKLVFADPFQLGCVKLIKLYRSVKEQVEDIQESGDGWNSSDYMNVTTRKMLHMNKAELEDLQW